MAIDIGPDAPVAPTAAELRAAKGGIRSLSPLPVIACFGDSISEQNTKAATGATMDSFAAIGYLTQAVALLKGRVRFTNALNFGEGGDTTALMLARLDTVVQSDAGIVTVLGGTNDVVQVTPVSYSAIVSNLEAIYTGLLEAGKTVIAIPILPRSGWSSSPDIPTSRRKLLRVNRWIRNFAYSKPHENFYVADGDIAVMNWASSDGDPLSLATYDGLHPQGRGAQWIAAALYPILDRILPPRIDQVVSPADLYHADNPTGALNVNPRMGGSGGTVGTGFSGTVSANYTTGRYVGSTFQATASVVSLPGDNGGSALQLVLGASGAGASTERLRVFQVITTSSGFASGDTVYGEIELDQADLVNVQYISCQVLDNDGVSQKNYYGLYAYADVDDREAATASRVIRTPEFVIAPYAGSGTQQLAIYLLIDAACGTAPSGTITVKAMALRKVV